METLATEVDSTWKLRPIDGSATLTIVTSMIVMNIAATYTTLTATFWLTRLVISAQCGHDRFSSVPGCRCGWHEGRGQAGHLGSPARTSQTVGGTEGRPRRGVMCRAR